MTLGEGSHKATFHASFLVVDQPSAYNAIFDRTLMKQTQMVTVVYCLIVKFLTPTRVGYIRADRTAARKCHLNSLRIVERFKSKQDVMEIFGDGHDIPLKQLEYKEVLSNHNRWKGWR